MQAGLGAGASGYSCSSFPECQGQCAADSFTCSGDDDFAVF
jgi:hypothetical protein